MTSLSVPISTAEPAIACVHCGLDVPDAMVERGAELQFCCAGCKAVYGAIAACGLDRYYALRESAESKGVPATTSARRFDDFDDETFRQRYCRAAADGLTTVELVLEGVHCAACVWLVEKLPTLLNGVAETRLNLGRKIVRITWADAAIPLSRIAQRLASFGYVPHALATHSAEKLRRAEDRAFLIRIAVAGALAGNVMLLSFALYGGYFHGIERQYFEFFRWTSLALTAMSLAWPGRVFFRGAINAVRTRMLNMDVPVALGLTAGAIWSAVSTVRGAGEVYFDSVTLLVLLLLVGRWVQLRKQRAGSDAVELLFSMTPRFARLVDGSGTRDVPIESLTPGQVVEVRATDIVPVDGTVIAGRSSVSTAWLTGESKPLAVNVGDAVHAGSVNASATLQVCVEATGASTRAGRLMQLVEESAQRRAPIVRLADRVASVFVGVVLVLAALTVAVWWSMDSSRGVENAIALLIITCPCALGLATPLAIVAAVGRAAGAGILIKGGDALQSLAQRNGVIYLDKTGTITEGCVTVHAWHGGEVLKPFVAALEAQSAHPVALAMVKACKVEAHAPCDVRDVEALDNGIVGWVDGVRLVIGARSCLALQNIVIPSWAQELEASITSQALSPVFIAADEAVQAVVAVGDSIREDAAASVRKLQELGWCVALLSGDHPDVARAVGAAVGIGAKDCFGGVTPAGKLAMVERAVRHHPTIMVGDGANDAAALAAATVGVAVHGGAEASLASADVYFTNAGLSALPELITGSRRTLNIIRRGLAVSLAYNVVGSSLAMAGLVNPLVAAVLMPLSSLTVITLAFRSRTFGASS